MTDYAITGMSCASCSARVEKAAGSVPGVTSCAVNLLTNSMRVEGDASSSDIIAAVEAAGYGASVKSEQALSAPAKEARLADTQTPVMVRRLAASIVFMLVLMYFSMGYTMWGWPAPQSLSENPMALGMLEMLLTIAIMVINQKFFISGFRSLFHGSPNMDTLVALGAGASFAYSVYVLFAMSAQLAHGMSGAEHVHAFYFESAGMILTLVTLGKTLEARSKGKATDALRGLMELRPEEAVVLRGGIETTVPAASVVPGDIYIVRPGERVPVDGVIIAGSSAVDESALTGESIPCDKKQGDTVSAATINRSGLLKCRATHVGSDMMISKIIRMVEDASAGKAPMAGLADRVAGIFVPTVITIAVIVIIIWMIISRDFSYALTFGVSVLVISCPCALGLATPVAVMVGSGRGARNGILYKTAQSIEESGQVDMVVFDKTGTITTGVPNVTDVRAVCGSETELLRLAYQLERGSEHPLASAIVKYAQARHIEALEVSDFQALPGNGVTAKDGAQVLTGGSVRYMAGRFEMPPRLYALSEELSGQGKTPLVFARDDRILGLIAVADVIKPESRSAVADLKRMGLHVVMLTGDNERTARAIAAQAGIDEVIAEVLPDEKEAVIRRLQEKGRVAMVGDGINDAPALTRADTGIAIGAGTDIAMDAADVVLVNSRLGDVPAAIRLSRLVRRNIKQNLFWAFIYNIIAIPLAAGAYVALLHWQLSPMIAAAAMSASSVCVVLNALRINFLKIRAPQATDSAEQALQRNTEPVSCSDCIETNEDGKEIQKGEESMTKTLKIEGMMCAHCEATVKKALEAVDGVESALVSHEEGTAVVCLNEDTEDAVLKEAVEAKDYSVTDIS